MAAKGKRIEVSNLNLKSFELNVLFLNGET
jgi:hypothetical protein